MRASLFHVFITLAAVFMAAVNASSVDDGGGGDGATTVGFGDEYDDYCDFAGTIE